MVALNRMRFAAPVFAQVASFVVVLAIGTVTGSSPSPVHRVRLTISVVSASGSTSAATTSPSRRPSRSASPTPTPSGKSPTPTPPGKPSQFGGRPVSILRVGSPVVVASGKLNSAGTLVRSVPKNGFYLVCVSPPAGWRSINAGAVVLPGWICERVRTGTGSATVRIALTSVRQFQKGSRP